MPFAATVLTPKHSNPISAVPPSTSDHSTRLPSVKHQPSLLPLAKSLPTRPLFCPLPPSIFRRTTTAIANGSVRSEGCPPAPQLR
eukprot:2073268-Pleurochrysis_carterae.AAC.2